MSLVFRKIIRLSSNDFIKAQIPDKGLRKKRAVRYVQHKQWLYAGSNPAGSFRKTVSGNIGSDSKPMSGLKIHILSRDKERNDSNAEFSEKEIR